MLRDGQAAPFHFHWKKSEDIIIRKGGTLIITMYESNPDGEFLDCILNDMPVSILVMEGLESGATIVSI